MKLSGEHETPETVEADVPTTPFRTRLYRTGAGNPQRILFIHGSGPGASAASTWQLTLPTLGNVFDCLAPDLIGFAASDHPANPPIGVLRWLDLWVDQIASLLDALKIESLHVAASSLGGAIALHLASRYPTRVRRLALVGSLGAPFTMTPKLDAVWGFYSAPSIEKMTDMMSWFRYEPIGPSNHPSSIAGTRSEMAMDPDVRRSYEAMFPTPRQRHVDECAVPAEALSRITHPCAIIHGRDDAIVPLKTSLYLLRKLPDAQLHIYGRCGHWAHIERPDDFHDVLLKFFREVVR